MKDKQAHIFDREIHEHYVEPEWCSRRLFNVERFKGIIHDPCCGFGRIPQAAKAAGLKTTYSDIIDRGYDPSKCKPWGNFLASCDQTDNIICNPPFNIFEQFANKALQLSRRKVAMIWIVPRLNAAGWLQDTPLARIWLLTPRPSMPPGHMITDGGKITGDTRDFCWIVWEKSYVGPPEIRWLKRDKDHRICKL